MKKIKYVLGIMIILSLLFISNVCFAETNFTNFDNVKLELKKSENLKYTSYKLYFNNVSFNTEHTYNIYITNAKVDSIDSNLESDGVITDGKYQNIDKFLEKKGDIYITVVESVLNEKSTVLLSKKLERPEQNSLGNRITGSFFTEAEEDSNIIFFNEPHDLSADDRKINIKIGKVEDQKILDNIKTNGEKGLNDLLTYAKNSKELLKETLASGMNKTKFLSKINLVDGDYYYIYFEADDENGKYYQVEDIMLTQAKYISSKFQLVSYTDSKFVWKNTVSETNTVKNNTSNETKTVNNTVNEIDNTVANKIIPAAGFKEYITLIIMGVVVIAGIIYFKYTQVIK